MLFLGFLVGLITSLVPVASAAQSVTATDRPAADLAEPRLDEVRAERSDEGVSGPAPTISRFAALGTVLRAQGFEVNEVCFLYRTARDSGYDAGRISILAGSLSELPVPDGVRDALGTLTNESTSSAAQLNARNDVANFFGGACSKSSVLETTCTLAVTLFNAQPIQLPRIAGQLQFVFSDGNLNIDAAAMERALERMGDPAGGPNVVQAGRDVVTAELVQLCDLEGAPTVPPEPEPTVAPAATPTPEPESTAAPAATPTPNPDDSNATAPENLPNTGQNSTLLAQTGLWALALGAAFMGMAHDEAARRRRRVQRSDS